MAEFEKQPPVALPATARWHSVLRHAVGSRRSLLGAAGWVSATFIAQQTLRLVPNIILAWLLAPALLRPMLLINTLRTAGELLTDLGVEQSLVNTPRRSAPTFYNKPEDRRVRNQFTSTFNSRVSP